MYDFIGQLSHSSADSSDIVYRVRHKASGQAYACKRISKHQAYGTHGGSAMRYTPFLCWLYYPLLSSPAAPCSSC